MGICVHVIESEFFINSKDLQKAINALEMASIEELANFLDDNGWVLTLDSQRNVTEIDFVDEKIHGEMDEWLPRLAPYVRKGSFIEFEGEVNLRYDFDGRRCLLRYSEELDDELKAIVPEVLFPKGEENMGS